MVNVLILSGYGINCERESAHAFELAGGKASIVHINDLISGEQRLHDYQILMFPGGFSYGDDTGSGNAFAHRFKSHLWDDLMQFIQEGKLILGVCNGFQIMSRMGLFSLDDDHYGEAQHALVANNQNRYSCRWTTLKTHQSPCVFTKGIDLARMPIAHGEGKFTCSADQYQAFLKNNQIVFTYARKEGRPANEIFPTNPNGSLHDVAAVCDHTGRIMGMMPHPERALYSTQLPDFHLQKEKTKRNGEVLPTYVEANLKLFQNAVQYFQHPTEEPMESNEITYKEEIRKQLHNTLAHGYVPELGMHKSGKVRDIHFVSDKIGEPIVMIASDRISSFDHVLSRQIPFKGQVLNALNTWAFSKTEDIVANASLPSPHPNVLVQRYYKNIMIECVVRGYVWGSMAQAYEDGERNFCGLTLPEGLQRYQKLDEPIFTPTTKSEHDEPMTFQEVSEQIGMEVAEKVRALSLALYKRGAELALEKGMVFIDTKYEFGLDEQGQLFLIDEANTPDSSRYCSVEEYEKYNDIQVAMSSGTYANVSDLLKDRGELKIKEMSKQFVRDVLIEKGFSYGSEGTIPELTDDDVVEVSYRYIKLYEQLTGEQFSFPSGNVKTELLEGLKQTGHIKGGLSVIMAGSDSDMPHIQDIQAELDKYEIPSQVRICSAHKQPTRCEEILQKYNESMEPLVIVGVAGGTDALSGVASFHSVFPVISCPPKKEEYWSCIMNPPGSSNSLVLRPANVAKHIAQILSSNHVSCRESIISKNKEKVKKLEAADN